MDVLAGEGVTLAPGARHAVATGFALAIPPDYEIQVRPRSGLALKHGIGIAPGQIFSSQGRFENCFRISYGEPWSEAIGQGLQTLGKLIREMR